jgi:hypothetical protein
VLGRRRPAAQPTVPAQAWLYTQRVDDYTSKYKLRVAMPVCGP